MNSMALSFPHFDFSAVYSAPAYYSELPPPPREVLAGVSSFSGSTSISDAKFAPMVGRPITEMAESLLDSVGFKAARTAHQKAISELAATWKQQLLNRHAELSANALTKTVKPVFKALTLYGAGAIDLRGLSADTVNGVHLAVILRATLTRKSMTPGWSEALSVARTALHRDGIDETDALAGLI